MVDQLLSWAALLFSGIAIFVAMRVQRRQPELIEKQIAELERGRKEHHKAQVVIRLERGDTWAGARGMLTIYLFNEGPAEARDIDIQFPDGNSPIPEAEAQAKLPIEVLQAGGSFELVAAVSKGNAPPYKVVLTWRDGLGGQVRETTLA